MSEPRAALTAVSDFAHALLRPALSIPEENDRDSCSRFLKRFHERSLQNVGYNPQLRLCWQGWKQL